MKSDRWQQAHVQASRLASISSGHRTVLVTHDRMGNPACHLASIQMNRSRKSHERNHAATDVAPWGITY